MGAGQLAPLWSRLHELTRPVLLVCVLLAAVATNLIGIFAVFGAFLLGAVLSDQAELRRAAHAKLHDLVTSFFVPVFFTYTGLRTDISALHGGPMWLICGVVVVAAVTGKLAGCGLAARVSGFTWKEAGIIGAMMNARGLMALIAINLGYELGVVPRSLFCMLVVMALATTVLTTPLLLWLRKGTEIEEPIDLVVVNLYPFEATIAKPGVALAEPIARSGFLGIEDEEELTTEVQRRREDRREEFTR